MLIWYVQLPIVVVGREKQAVRDVLWGHSHVFYHIFPTNQHSCKRALPTPREAKVNCPVDSLERIQILIHNKIKIQKNKQKTRHL